MSSKKVLHISSPIEKALIDAFENLNHKKEKQIDDCLANLAALKEIPPHEVNIQDLKIQS